MTTFKATVKKPRSDGFYTVYIRVTHQRKTSYIKTNKIIDPAHITSSGELTDPVVNEYCAIIIRQYTDKLNRVDATFWELKDVIEFLHKNDEETCFSDYARKFISKMESEGHERNAKNYKLAVNHLERYIDGTKLLQKSEMRKNMVMDLIYRGFIYAANYSESHYNPRRSQIKTELRYLFVTTPNR